MMGHREKMVNGDEVNCFGPGRQTLCLFKNPKVARKTKARFNRRVRLIAKREAKAEAFH